MNTEERDSIATPFINFERFLKPRFKKEVAMYKHFLETPPSFEEYKQSYVKMHGIKPWLATLQGLKATEKQLYSILNTYMKYANRSINDVPQLLAWLDRYFDIETPLVEGIATSEYWRKRLEKNTH
tara:strand:+ start:63 stop:440 length:378 start_codon:yes stop_codon:yes gene_type:complete